MGNKKKIQIPFEYHSNFILVQVRLENVFNLRLIFDTGASNTILFDKMITDLLQVTYDKKVMLQGTDKHQDIPASIVRRLSFHFPKLGSTDMDVVVLDENVADLSVNVGVNVHGILGANFFNGFVIKINYQRQYIELIRPEYFTPPGHRWASTPIEIQNEKPHVLCPTRLSETDRDTLLYLLDSGSALPVLIHSNSSRSLAIIHHSVPGYLGTGLGGHVQGFRAKISQITLADHPFSQLVVGWQDLDSTLLRKNEYNRNGLIGNPMLSKFHVILDYAQHRLYLKPNRRFDEEWKVDRSGLTLIAGGAELDLFHVREVMKNSPAEQAGLCAGDQIIRINGWPTSWMNLESLVKKFQKKAGKKYRIRFLRKGHAMQTTLVLKDLL